jgi:hypothetical protein
MNSIQKGHMCLIFSAALPVSAIVSKAANTNPSDPPETISVKRGFS